jgi:hypothetical protein
MCGEMAALRLSVDAHMWSDRVADALAARQTAGTPPGRNRAAARRRRPRRLYLAGDAS